MNRLRLLLALLVAATLSACAANRALGQATHSCLKYPTPSARDDCEERAKGDNTAFAKEIQRREQVRARAPAEADLQTQAAPAEGSKPAPQKKNELCFKRASGEMVCPN